jgi:EmrB/QacA subfamily drug resistance transporter
MSDQGLAYATPRGRWVLAATVLGTAMAFLDQTVVNVALPSIGRSLGGGLAGLTWVINAYSLTLASFILLGGSLGDRYGRRRVFLIGAIWFAIASLFCGIAPTLNTLIAARALQGVGAALLTPGSLAILQSSFREQDRARAIGAWSGLGGLAAALGPFVGGWIIQVASWRWTFLINLPFAIAVVLIALRSIPESRDETAPKKLDIPGAALGAIGLCGVTQGLIAAQDKGFGSPEVLLLLLGGVAGLLAFLGRERWTAFPMMPLSIFSSRLFATVNVVTFVVYAALSGVFFWLVLELQVTSGFSPMKAGLALLPVTVIMLLLSARGGALAQRIGPRLPMTIGPLLAALGTAALVHIGADASFLRDVLPGQTALGLGLSLTVAPLTSTVLAAAPQRHAGLASGVNNAVARVAGLISIAALPLVAGLSGDAYHQPALLEPAYRKAMWVCTGLLVLGGVLSALLVRRPSPQ